jgi:hypothetical protein
MAGNITGLHVFANDIGPEALSLLDGNFSPLATALNNLNNFTNYYADTGSVNALTVTLIGSQTLTLAAGLALSVKVANTNTSTTVTLNANGTGAVQVFDTAGNSIAIGSLIANATYLFIYDGSVWRLLNPSVFGGTFTITGNGFSSNPTGTATWSRSGPSGGMVTINVPALLATSNATTFTLTGIPSAIQPATLAAQYTPIIVAVNSGVVILACIEIVNGSGTWTVGTTGVGSGSTYVFPNGWSNSGNKGIGVPTSFSYLLF